MKYTIWGTALLLLGIYVTTRLNNTLLGIIISLLGVILGIIGFKKKEE